LNKNERHGQAKVRRDCSRFVQTCYRRAA
jgi:hypothetical protein